MTDFGPAAQKLFDDMIETLHVSDGVGLAAPQIGISQRIFIACPTMKKGEEFVMINGIIEKKSGTAVANEGCLSLPGISAGIVRATKLRLTFQDRLGKVRAVELEDFFARVIQHEMDHLNGILLIDHFTGARRKELIDRYTVLKEQKETSFPATRIL